MTDPLLSDDDMRECLQCEYPEPHEGGMLAALDEWHHRCHDRPYGHLIGWLFRPVCKMRDRRLWED